MSVEATKTSEVASEAIKGISHIATLPEVTTKILELVEDPSSTAKDLHDVIAVDPALCSRILKVVNSSFYGLPGQIGSINRAIVLLGLNAVKNIAISASMAKMFRGGQLCPEFSAKELWKHSVATATAAKLICDDLKMGLGDEAFLAGLIHDIGIMVELQHDRLKLIEVVQSLGLTDGVPAKPMTEAEAELFGATHEQFGSALCERWKFPQSLVQAAGFHHHPLDLESGGRRLACVVAIADRLSGELEEGFRLDLTDLTVDPAVMEEIGLTQDRLVAIRERVGAAIEDAQAMLA